MPERLPPKVQIYTNRSKTEGVGWGEALRCSGMNDTQRYQCAAGTAHSLGPAYLILLVKTRG